MKKRSRTPQDKTVAQSQRSNCSMPAARVPSAVLAAVEFLVSSVEEQNLCVECGEDMGPQNPRQLCGKWRCTNAEWP